MIKRILTSIVVVCIVGALSAQEKPKVYLVGGAHFDSQWNWDVQTSISEYIPKTIERNLLLLEKYPDYIFNFEGGVKYAWMKEYYPQYWNQIKRYVEEGRWHVTGSTWDANDVNIPSMESFTRNILYGQHFFRNELGVQSTDIYLPDCFGFGWTLPTVAAHSGLIGFVTQKMTWREKPFYGDKYIPFEIGLWQGVDGSRVMMVANCHSYVTKWPDEDLSKSEKLAKLASENVNNLLYHTYGTGDTGGSPTMESAHAVQRSINGEGPLEIISAESDRMFKDYLPYESHPELPVFDGELLMDVHATGCYTSQAAMKLYNRRNELLADAAERSAVMADWADAVTYPKEFLTEAWKRVIWHQFHDDLTGTSIPRAYEFSWNDELISLKQFENVLTSSVGGFSGLLDTKVKGRPVVIYNPAAFEVNDIVELSYEGMPDNVSVYDQNGRRVVSQIVGTGDQRKLLVCANVPATGYVVYDVRNGAGSAKTSKVLMASEKGMENAVYKLSFDANGDICSIFDKRSGKELVENGKSVRLAMFTDNKSHKWPAWEILKEVVDQEPVSVTDDVKISVVEKGPVRVTVCVERKHGKSVFKQYVSLTDGAQDDRIDIVNHVDWKSRNALLKAEFPMAVTNEKAVYDLGVGTIARGNNTDIAYEIYAQQWADLTSEDGSHGVAVINDCKYGWDKPADNVLRLTLLHTPGTKGRYSYQSRQDLGKHVFTYSIVSHEGDYRNGDIVRKAEVMNQPLKAFVASKHRGAFGRSFSFVESLNSNVALRALKQAEDSDAYVVRFYETSGIEAQQAKVRFCADIVEAKELNGNEDEIGGASFSGNTLDFEIKPYSMKTYLVRLAKPEAATEAVSVPVQLEYNMKTASYNAFRKEVNFDGNGYSYAAELLPETLTFKGVDFKMGDPALPNAIKCRQDTVALPEGDFNKLYVLAAATRRDTKCRFSVGGLEQDAVVPYYGGFIGQWGHDGHTEGFIKAADVAYVGTHKHGAADNKDIPYDYTYLYSIELDIPSGAEWFVLPANQQIAVFAVTAINQKDRMVEPCSDLLRIGMLPEESGEDVEIMVNLTSGKPVVGKSGEISSRQSAPKALDENSSTKWCDISTAAPKFIEVDLQKETVIRGWSVLHAGMESLKYITKEYSLQVRNTLDEEWKTVDSVYDNVAFETERLLKETVKARYVRLNVTKPDQDEGTTVRIYEFVVF